jgi:hypothetical protein
MMKNTRYFGHDCMGNTPHAVTIEGTCIADIYRDAGERYYNQDTGERGFVALGADGELHFTPATPRDEYPAQFRMAGIGEIIIPESDGGTATLLRQIRCILDGHGTLDFCPTTGELIIRTGLDVQMGGELVLMDDDSDSDEQ